MASDEETKKHLAVLRSYSIDPHDDLDMARTADYFEAMAAELARLRTALESAQGDRQRAVDDLFAQLRVNVGLRAESMRGAVEALEWAADVFWNGSNFLERRKELIARIAELKQRAASQKGCVAVDLVGNPNGTRCTCEKCRPECCASQTTEHPPQKEP